MTPPLPAPPKAAWSLLLLVSLVILGLLLRFYGYEQTWRAWGIPVAMPPFLDLRLITGSAESMEHNFDPALENPNDPTQRFFNYPKLWYPFLRLGIGQRATIPMAIASLALYFTILAIFPRPKDWLTIALLWLVTFSSAAMLEYERCNVDIWFFVSVTTALLLLERNALGSFFILLVSILFKIFPVFAAGMFLDKQKNRTWLYLPASLGATAIYFLVTWKDMLTIFNITQKGKNISYGFSVAPLHLRLENGINFPHMDQFFLGLVLLVSLAALITGWKTRLETAATDLHHLRAFWAGAAIYVGTFLLGNSWDYRLIFLLLTIPALAGWLQNPNSGFPQLIRVILISLLLSCWHTFLRHWFPTTSIYYQLAFWIDETANWTLYFGLLTLLTASLPAWLIHDTLRILRLNPPHAESNPV
jgi:hypothetical protein